MKPAWDQGAFPALDWVPLDSRYVIKDPWFTLREDGYLTPAGRTIRPYYVLEPDTWVNVLALTKESDAVLVRLYRPGIRRSILELPGGTTDPDDISPLDAIRRELLEETGYGGGEFDLLATLSPNPASHSNLVHSFLARGVEKVSDVAPDENEHMEVVLMPLDELVRLARNSGLVQAMQVATLFLALSHMGRPS
jgi:ADP-ribose pyrophosphatase